MNRLSNMIPIVRGLLAEPTGEQDTPYKPVILKSLTSKKALDFASAAKNAQAESYPAPLSEGSKPPLFVDRLDADGPVEELSKQLKDAVSDYSARHESKPEIVCLRGLGILHIDS